VRPPSIDVFRHQDYRAFLREYYEARRARRDGFSLRAFSRRVGLRSPNYLKLVIDGVRNLTPEMAIRFAEGCGLAGEALEYFCALVALNQAHSSRERDLHYGRIKRLRRYRKVYKLDAAQDAYHSQWYIPAIRELIARGDFEEDPKWIAKALLPSITPREAERALKVLCELGLLVRQRRTGRLVQSEPLVETQAGPLGHHLVSFHRAMMARAAEAIDRVPRDEREIASLTLCLSQTRMLELKTELERFRAELLQNYPADEVAERVVQVNFQMFPLSKKRSDG
jgi:uncharacterized protein (TIGR02147 family)